MILKLPYGKGMMKLDIPDKEAFSVIRSFEVEPAKDEVGEINRALSEPVKSEKLIDFASGKKRICVTISDYTRATPNKLLIPPILERLKVAGCKMDDINILVANGLHKPASRSELRALLGRELLEKVSVVNHDAENEEQLAYVGRTSFGTDVSINKLIVESDLVIATGLIEPHFFAGYSGGRKSIFPGVAGERGIFQNHSFKMLNHSNSRYGILNGNPVHEDMVEASKLVKLDYIVNVTTDRDNKIMKTFAGDPIEAHMRGARFLENMTKIKVASRAEIVIVSNGGYPLDRDLYQSVKGMATGESVVKKGGTIIIFSECVDGIGRGHESFYQLMAEAKSPHQVLERIRKRKPVKDQWEAQVLAKILKVANVIVVTKNIRHELIQDMHMIPASTADEALSLAYHITVGRPKIIAIPEGPYVIPFCSDLRGYPS